MMSNSNSNNNTNAPIFANGTKQIKVRMATDISELNLAKFDCLYDVHIDKLSAPISMFKDKPKQIGNEEEDQANLASFNHLYPQRTDIPWIIEDAEQGVLRGTKEKSPCYAILFKHGNELHAYLTSNTYTFKPQARVTPLTIEQAELKLKVNAQSAIRERIREKINKRDNETAASAKLLSKISDKLDDDEFDDTHGETFDFDEVISDDEDVQIDFDITTDKKNLESDSENEYNSSDEEAFSAAGKELSQLLQKFSSGDHDDKSDSKVDSIMADAKTSKKRANSNNNTTTTVAPIPSLTAAISSTNNKSSPSSSSNNSTKSNKSSVNRKRQRDKQSSSQPNKRRKKEITEEDIYKYLLKKQKANQFVDGKRLVKKFKFTEACSTAEKNNFKAMMKNVATIKVINNERWLVPKPDYKPKSS